jgi:hypothetical protein
MSKVLKSDLVKFLKEAGFKHSLYGRFTHQDEVIMLPKGKVQERNLKAIFTHLDKNGWRCAIRFKRVFLNNDMPEVEKHVKMRTLEAIAMMSLKEGDSFYSNKEDKALTSIAAFYKKKIRTERLIVMNPNEMTMNKVVRVTLL